MVKMIRLYYYMTVNEGRAKQAMILRNFFFFLLSKIDYIVVLLTNARESVYIIVIALY